MYTTYFMMLRTLLAGLLWLALFGCSPARRIEMINKGSDTAVVIWTSLKDSIGFNPFNISNNRELRFTIPPNQNSAIHMSFGYGSWSPAEVEELIKRLESFQIICSTYNVRIDSLPQLRDYLLSRRRGLGGSRIRIVIEP